MAEAVKVIVRCRPLNQREKDLKCETVVDMDSNTGLCTLRKPGDKTQPPKNFTFDGAYFIDSTTEGIYNDICFTLVEGVLEGYNGTVFAYGQTGCGKSFSMQGITDPASQRGIIPRAFEHIFESVGVSEHAKFLIHASYLEIYNEEIRDLLGKDHKSKLELKEHPDRGVYVKDLSKHPVNSSVEMEHVMELGSRNRSVGATLMNADSSRSHSIFSIFIEILDTAEDGGEHIRAGKLNLVDLAGSERQSKTGATGDRLKEATKINLSLSALGNVISALVDGKAKHIPYRDSKLTRLLQDSLGGNTKTLMVACLSPADNNYDETLSTLRYANRAKNIKNKPKINEDPKDALLREYKEEIEKLKKMLMGQMDIPTGLLDASASAVVVPQKTMGRRLSQEHTIAVQVETEKVRQEYETRIADMKTMYEAEQMSKQKLQAEMDRLKGDYSKKVHDIEEHYAIEEGLVDENANGVTSVTPDHGGSTMSVIALDEARRASESHVALKTDQSMLHMLQDKMHQGIESMQHSSNIALHMIQDKVIKAGVAATAVDTKGAQQEALKRLQELQEKMVGGEKKGDQKLKEKRKARKAFAKTRKEKLFLAAKKMDDEGISTMVKVYDSLQDEIKYKTKHIDHLEKQLSSVQADVDDLQEEFERDREDYLDTIRRQEQMMKLQQQILDKIQPCIRRDCNYYNIDRVKAECVWDEDNGKWNLPDLVVSKTTLPAPGGIMPGGSPQVRRKSPTGSRQIGPQGHLMNGYTAGVGYEEPRDDRFLHHLAKNSHGELAANYFKPKRAEKLLSHTNRFETSDRREATSPVGPRQTGSFSSGPPPRGFGSTQAPPQPDGHVSRPVRLESLNMPIEKERKKKKKKQSNMDDRRFDQPW